MKEKKKKDKYLIKIRGGLKDIFSIFTRFKNRKEVKKILPDVPVELFMR